ncbi:MAG: hypothetical protein Q4C86_02505 [bacterium]|nr:hypothetical protein [bacterium]
MTTRVLQYAKLLSQNGYNVHFLTSDPLTLPEYSPYPHYRLNFYADNFEEHLLALIREKSIDVVEFQFKSDGYLRNLNIERLKEHVRAGCTIHGDGGFCWKRINKLDYRLVVSGRLAELVFKDDIKDYAVILNAVEEQPVQWKMGGDISRQKTALHISRLSSDKLEFLETFVKYCVGNGIEFEIAGCADDDYDLKRRLIRKFGLDENCFIGEIETTDFLKEHICKYLFVAGVGLVILEAGMLNYPVFITSRFGVENSTFLSAENFTFFEDSNMTIFGGGKAVPKTQDISRIKEFQLGKEFARSRNIKEAFAKYLKVIEQ